MSKIPFYIGNFAAMFVPDGARRARVRGNINRILYTPRIKRFIWKNYHEHVKNIRFVRQINLNRVCLVADEKYYIKFFRNISARRVKNYKELLDFIQPYLSIQIPQIVVGKHTPMYVSKKIPGHSIDDFDTKTILKNEDKIKSQVANIISEIQKIDVKSIPNYERYNHSLQPERNPEPATKKPKMVLANFDLNETNLLFDDDMNIRGLIDWDMCSISRNPDTDMSVFTFFWNRRFHNA